MWTPKSKRLVQFPGGVPASDVAGQPVKPSPARIWFIAIGAAMWGLDGVLIVALLHHFTSTQIVFLEHLLLAFFAIPVLIWKRHELRRLNAGDWAAILFIAWGGSAIASILFAAGFRVGNANVVLIMQKLQPVFAVSLAAYILKERLPRGFWLILAGALCGAYLLTFGFHVPHTAVQFQDLTAALLSIGASILWGGSTVMGKRLVSKLSFSTVTSLRFAFALPFLAVLVIVQHPNVSSITSALGVWQVWSNLLFQTVVPSLLSLLVYYFGLSGVKASHATIAELAFPAVGLVLNWVILHQTISWGQWIGFAVVWAAVLLLSMSRNGPAAASDDGDTDMDGGRARSSLA